MSALPVFSCFLSLSCSYKKIHLRATSWNAGRRYCRAGIVELPQLDPRRLAKPYSRAASIAVNKLYPCCFQGTTDR
jgi:hypothetical protein